MTTPALRDRWTGLVILLVAIAWIIGSEYVIPSGYSGSAFGPRTFPTGLGILLAILAVVLIAGTFRRRDTLPPPAPSDAVDEPAKVSTRDEMWGAAATFGFLIIYFVAMQVLGFMLATVLLVATFNYFVLGSRSLVTTGAVALGLGVGVWYLMGHLLGVYLPTGMLGLGV
ncbi:tripartite tricarboxylate transporter TctB family protein [Mangrovicella endophytica]|uniref:tripartite tricarboxylate transporter TctB family protein n=1 Tax=Mangrovicella endophytica TaxID=2066697 RepID=UPI000C9E772D|nr:tripartite tricarboxylate transporter TctB family protein [Mangrovicella endophytica]